MQQRNNQLVVCIGAILGFLCAIPVQWYTIRNGTMPDGSTWPFSLPMTGINGSFKLLIETPIWFLLVMSAFVTSVAVLNLFGLTTIPRTVLAVGLILPGIDYVAPFFIEDEHVSLAIGPALATVATLAALGVVFAKLTIPRVAMRMADPAATSLWR